MCILFKILLHLYEICAQVHLNTIIHESPKAMTMMRHIHQKTTGKTLDDFARNLLVESVVEYFVQKSFHMTPGILKRITDQIIEKFPQEDKVNKHHLSLLATSN
jgi:hypothetical protein